MINSVVKLFGIARRTYFHWKKDINKNKSINLIEKYFTEKDLEEFMETGTISSFHTFNIYQKNLESSFERTIKLIDDMMGYEGLFLYFKFFSKYKEVLFEKTKNTNNERGLRPNGINSFIQNKLFEFYVDEKIHNSDLSFEFSHFSIYLFEMKFEYKSYLIQAFYTNFKYINDKETQKLHIELSKIKDIETFFNKYQEIIKGGK